MAAPPSLYLIDGSNNLYRSYYAIRGLTTSAGLATNAVYGFTQMLRKLLKEQKPDSIAVAFDVGGPKVRLEKFVDYKKDRKPMPDDLSVQVPFIHEVCAAFGIRVITTPDYEADDLLGSLACVARERGFRVVLATSDKDFFQLIGDGVELFHTTREVLYDEKGVKELFGLEPKQVVDVMAIWGDAIDNIPGVPGIGEKGAKSLIDEFGSLDNLYANLDKVKKPAHRKALEQYREQAFLSRELATIKCDLEIDVDLDSLKLADPDRAKLHELFSRLEFTSLMQEYMPAAPAIARTYHVVESAEQLAGAIASEQRVAVHFEQSPFAAAISTRPYEAFVVALADDRLAAVLREQLPQRVLVAHDIKSLLRFFMARGWTIPQTFDDPMLVSYVLNPGLPSHALDVLARDRLKRDLISRKELEKGGSLFGLDEPAVNFVGERAEIPLALLEILEKEMTTSVDEELRRIYETIEKPLVPVLARMEERGIRIDVDLLGQMSARMGEQIADLEVRIYAAAGQEFNINSPSQLGTILFEKLQYPVLKKTQKTKSYSTGVEVLSELASYGYEVPKLILEHRELHKLKSTYVDALPQLVGRDGRVHTSFNQAVAATGRLSSSDPNLQNIPIRTPQGREIRKAFVADQGCVLIAADYSQIELRVLAHVCGDEELISTFQRGADIHRATAARIFNVPEEAVTADQRRAMKTINFGVLYGMSAFRLSNELGISTGEAKEFIDAYFSRYPRINEYLSRTLDEARATGKVRTLFGRIRYITEIHNRSFAVRGNAERMAINAPIQGTAADLLKLAMIELDRTLPPDARMLLTVHDEIVFEVPEERADEIANVVRTTMETIHPLDVPLAVETHWGRSWFEAKE